MKATGINLHEYQVKYIEWKKDYKGESQTQTIIHAINQSIRNDDEYQLHLKKNKK